MCAVAERELGKHSLSAAESPGPFCDSPLGKAGAGATAKPFAAASLAAHVIIQQVQCYRKSPVLVTLWVLIFTCAYFSNAINFKLENAKLPIAGVETYCVHVSSVQQLLYQLCPHVANVEQVTRPKENAKETGGCGVMINSHTCGVFFVDVFAVLHC